MKKSKILALALCLTCLPVHVYEATASEVNIETVNIAPQFRVFNQTDEALAAVYPGTMAGWNKVDVEGIDIISVVRKIEADGKSATGEEVQALRTFYFNKFFNFMDGLKERRENTLEFLALWDNICQEAATAAAGGLGELQWRFVEVMFMRGLLLASGGGSPEAQNLLSTVPDMNLFFGALADTPTHLRTLGQPVVPAWQHSSVACIINSTDDETRGHDVHHPHLQPHPLDWDTVKPISKEAKRLGLHKEVYLPMVDAGKIGITTLVKMWLNQIFGVPLTYGEYTAHGINLGSAVGAMHDKAHGIVDNRRREVKQAIANLLNAANTAGKNPRAEALPLATRHMVSRFNALNQTLLAYVEAKERRAVEALSAAKALAPDDADNAQRKEAEKIARRRYNTGITGLFQALHEAYAMKANVLEAPTLAEAITRLCANATGGENTTKFNELETFFNPYSDLTNEEIFARIGTRSLESVGVYAYGNNGAIMPTTIAEYAAQGKVFMDTLHVNRGAVYTEIAFDVVNGKRVKIQVPTSHYLVNTAKDENAVLGLVGQKVSEADLPTDHQKRALRVLPEEFRRVSLKNAQVWLTEVEDRTNTLVSGLSADLLTHIPAEAMATYNQLAADQNAEWTRFMPPVEVAAPPVTETALVVWSAPSQL